VLTHYTRKGSLVFCATIKVRLDVIPSSMMLRDLSYDVDDLLGVVDVGVVVHPHSIDVFTMGRAANHLGMARFIVCDLISFRD